MAARARVPADLFRFTHGDRADLYSAILNAFGEANDRLETALVLDQVRLRLRGVGWFDAVEGADLVGALRSLTEWQLLDATQDHTGELPHCRGVRVAQRLLLPVEERMSQLLLEDLAAHADSRDDEDPA